MNKMSGMMTVMRKELARFFGDKRMVMTTVILPGLMIFAMYHFMGEAFSSQGSLDQKEKIVVQVYQMPESQRMVFEAMENVDEIENAVDGQEAGEIFGEEAKAVDYKSEEAEKHADAERAAGAAVQGDKGALNLDIQEIKDEAAVKKAKKKVTDQKAGLCILFPKNFDDAIASYTSQGGEIPKVEIYYNQASNASLQAYQMMTNYLDGFESSISNVFDVNPPAADGSNPYNLATDEDTIASMFASLLPMLLMMFLYSGCVSVAPESIAGEKERGTIATLLVTPVRRSDIALGKIAALSLISLLSGASSTVGTILALPEMMSEEELSANVYHVSDYLILTVVILSTVLVMVTVIAIISTFAKSVKEAQTYVTPLMVVVMLVGISAMFGDDAKSAWYYYCLPMYNSVQSMISIFSFKIVPQNIVITIAANVIYTGVGTFLLAKMFHSERVIFS